MGFGGISIWQLLIVLAIVLALFGTKKLRSMGSDLGNAVKGFRGAMKDGEEEVAAPTSAQKDNQAKLDTKEQSRVIDSDVTSKDEKKV